MEDLYPKAYKEVIEILKFVPENYVNKISKQLLDMLKKNMDNNYYFNPEDDKEWLDETKAILANIYRDYWATQEQKTAIEEIEKHEKQQIEEKKRIKYNPNDIFKNKNKKIKKEELSKDINLPIEVKKENFFKKLINKIKYFFER